jgi:hypothetical protein
MPGTSDYMMNTAAAPADLAATARRLTKSGFLAANSTSSFRDGVNLLVTHLRHATAPARETLTARIEEYAARPRPYLPRASRELGASETFTAWINPRRILLKSPGTRSFIHDNSHAARSLHTSPSPRDHQPVEPLDGLPDLAERIALEKGDPDGLKELFGDPNSPTIQVEAWNMPIGPLFRIETNGNHRLAALAAIGAPCVLAEVRIHTGCFDTSPRFGSDQDEEIERYRRLLQTFDIASFSDTGPLAAFGISTRWPILIRGPESAVNSLAAAEQLTDGPAAVTVGRIPRSWFGSAEQLDEAAQDLDATLDRFISRRSVRRRIRFRGR